MLKSLLLPACPRFSPKPGVLQARHLESIMSLLGYTQFNIGWMHARQPASVRSTYIDRAGVGGDAVEDLAVVEFHAD